MNMQSKPFDVLVIGDEVESILTAVSAAKALYGDTITRGRIGLIRRSAGILGGLSTRGGLSYMDITPEYATGLFQAFLEATGVKRVALDPNRAHDVLSEWLDSHGIEIYSGMPPESFEKITFEPDGHWHLTNTSQQFSCRCLIDATPDGDIARRLGIPYLCGLEGLLTMNPPPIPLQGGTSNHEFQNFLGVTPVFRLTGLEPAQLQAFEYEIRQRPDMREILAKALPDHPENLREDYLVRPTYCPPELDYLDILNPAIGILYHLWRHGEVDSYPHAKIAVDGGNISLLPDSSMGFNGMVMRVNTLQELLYYSHEGAIPDYLRAEMQHFETFLQQGMGLPDLRLVPPEALYVRQTVTLRAKNNVSAQDLLSGGIKPEKALGTFSYWLDMRGIVLSKYFPGETLPKPVFNLTLDVCLPNPGHCHLKNFAFLGRSAGYSPLSQGACRIVQHNALLGESLGIAAALAATQKVNIEEIPISNIRKVLVQRYGGQSFAETPAGKTTASEDFLVESKALEWDREILERFYSDSLLQLK